MINSTRPVLSPRNVLALLICLLVTAPAIAALTPTPFEVEYLINRNGMPLIEMGRNLKMTGTDTFQFESNSRATSNIRWLIKDRIKEISLFESDQHLRPLQYQYERKGGRKFIQEDISFDWTTKIAIDQHIPDKPVLFPDGTTDKLLYQLQLMFDLATGKRELNYTIVEKGRLRHYQFKHIGNEKLGLPVGTFETIILKRDTGKRTTTIWCAPTLDYLPIRIEHTEKDGSKMQANLIKFNGLPFAQPDTTTTLSGNAD